jgi:hypothetical protein
MAHRSALIVRAMLSVVPDFVNISEITLRAMVIAIKTTE